MLGAFLLLLQSIQSNWNNKINVIQYGILYTSSRLVGTSVEDSADKQKDKRTFKFHPGTV